MRVYYFIPEDGDKTNHPNAFSMPGQTPTVAEVKRRFPLQPNPGEYFLFRFKYKLNNAIQFVWLDVLEDATQAPRISTSSIFMKVSRMAVESSDNRAHQPVATRATQQRQRSAQQSKGRTPTRNPPAVVDDDEVDLFCREATEAPSPAYEGFICPRCKGNLGSPEELINHQRWCTGPPDTPSSEGRLLSFGDAPAKASAGASEARLLSFSAPEKAAPAPAPPARLVSFSDPSAGGSATASPMDLADLDFTAAPSAPAPAAKKTIFSGLGSFSM